MKTGYAQFRYLALALWGVTALFSASAALAAPNPSEAQARYQQERAMCERGQSHQDRATCLREAGAAYNEAKRGWPDDRQAQYEKNSLVRCNPLPPEDRKACIARMQGQGTTRGSVAEGGIYRELVTREPASAEASGQSPAGSAPVGSGAR